MKYLFILITVITGYSCSMPQEYPVETDSGSPSSSISIYPRKSSVIESSQIIFSVYLMDKNGLCTELSPDEYSLTIDNDIASLSKNILTAGKKGDATVSVRYEDLECSARLTVRSAPEYHLLRISEVMYDPASEPSGEFIEIYNAGSSECDLSGLYLTCGKSTDAKFLFGEIILPSHSFYVAGNSKSGFSETYGSEANTYGLPFTLRNTGETVSLYKPDGNLIDRVYIKLGTAELPAPLFWGSLVSGDKLSVYRKDPDADSDTQSDFEAGTPTPGR